MVGRGLRMRFTQAPRAAAQLGRVERSKFKIGSPTTTCSRTNEDSYQPTRRLTNLARAGTEDETIFSPLSSLTAPI